MEDTNKEKEASVNQFSKGLSTDTSPIIQPEGTLRFALNAVDESEIGDSMFPGNAEGNEVAGSLKEGYIAIGKVYMRDGNTAVFSTNGTVSEIGIYNDKTGYHTWIPGDDTTKNYGINDATSTDKLDFSTLHQIDAIYRLRRGCDDTVYWTDNLNPVRSYIFNRPEDFLVDEKFSATKTSLFSRFKGFPRIDTKVIEQGELVPGSYNIAIQYLDSDLNPTEWITVSETIIIYNDSLSNNFSKIRGSTNEKNIAYDFPKSNKAIVVNYTNLDKEYPFARLALIEATNGSGSVSKVTATLELPITDNGTLHYTFTGNNTFTNLTVEEIAQQALFIDTAQSIEQVENRLILGNIKNKENGLCDLQSHASKIVANCTPEEVVLDMVTEVGNPKRPTANLEKIGYMPGEIYSFGIVYVFNDGTTSPVYHIPGRGVGDVDSNMSINNTCESVYTDRSKCDTGDFWGIDNRGLALKGTPIRHHRFPTRESLDIPLISKVEKTIEALDYTKKEVSFTPIDSQLPIVINDFNPTGYTDAVFGIAIYYISALGNPSTKVINGSISLTTKEVDLTSVQNDIRDFINTPGALRNVSNITGFSVYIVERGVDTPTQEIERYEPEGGHVTTRNFPNYNFKLDFTDKIVSKTETINATVSNVFGITFSKVTPLPENVIGYYIVRNERSDNDKTVLDSGIMLPVLEATELKYHNAFGNITPTYATNILTKSQAAQEKSGLRNDAYCLIYPEFLFNNKEFKDFDLIRQGSFEVAEDRVVIGMTRDIMAGTSYNPKVHDKTTSESTEDGFDLKTVVKTRKLNYVNGVSPSKNILKNEIKDLRYVKALSSITMDNTDTESVFFNICSDNNIAFLQTNLAKDVFDTNLKAVATKSDITAGMGAGLALTYGLYLSAQPDIKYTPYDQLYDKLLNKPSQSDLDEWDRVLSDKIYGEYAARTLNNYPFYYLVKENLEPYSDFRQRKYINISENYFTGNSAKVFGGDSYVAPLSYFTSYFQTLRFADRKKKNNTWLKIAAIGIAVAGAVTSVFTLGASVAITAIALTAIGIGAAISTAAVVIEQNKISEIYDKAYQEGLKECLHDNENDFFFSDKPLKDKDENFTHYISNDDEVQWAGNLLEDLWFETSVNINWRNGNSRGLPDFLNPLSKPSDKQIRDYFINKLTVSDSDNQDGRLYTGYALAEQYNFNKDYARRNAEKPYFALGIEYDCCSDCIEEFTHRVHYSEQSFQEELTDNYKIFLPNNYRDIDGETGEIVNIFKIQNNLFIHTREGLWNLPKNYQERITDQIVSFIGTGSYFEIPPQKIVDDDTGNSYGTYHKWSRLKTPYGYFFVCESQNAICQFTGKEVKAISNQGMYYWFYNNIPMDDAALPDNPSNPAGSGFIGVYDSKKELIIYTKKHIVDGVNKSWTVSYNLKKGTWGSFHSFLPYFYIQTPQYYFSMLEGNKNIWRHNVLGKYQEYYGKTNPFIIEYVVTGGPLLNKVFENLTVFVETKKYDATTKTFYDVKGIFFDQLLCYNSRQISGVMEISVKNKSAQDFFSNQVENNLMQVIADRNERNWAINELRDMSSGASKPLFIENIEAEKIQENYFIDKVVNAEAINMLKDWTEIESFRDKYLVVRLIFNNFDKDIKMITNFTASNETVSGR